jgi:hypothetical protein
MLIFQFGQVLPVKALALQHWSNGTVVTVASLSAGAAPLVAQFKSARLPSIRNHPDEFT